MADRKKIATSHEGRYSYWLDADRYVYQHNEETKVWVGWLCHVSAWERTFKKSAGFSLEN